VQLVRRDHSSRRERTGTRDVPDLLRPDAGGIPARPAGDSDADSPQRPLAFPGFKALQ